MHVRKYEMTNVVQRFLFLTGEKLAPDNVISKHLVYSEIECSFKCLQEQECVGYNYCDGSVGIMKDEANCEISHNNMSNAISTMQRRKSGRWTFYLNVNSLPVVLIFVSI